MAEHRALPAQAMVIVDVEIVGMIGEQSPDPGDLVRVLGDMGLHQALGMLAPQPAGHRELLRRTGARETRRDGVEQPAAAVPLRDQGLQLVVARLRRVAQPVGRVAIHQHLAGGQPQSELLRLLEQRVDRLRMNGAVDAARGDAVAQILLQEDAGDVAGKFLVGEFELGGIGVFVQPVEKLRAVGRDHRRLREMDVAVDEARRDQRVLAIVADLDVGRQVACDSIGRAEMRDLAVGHHHDGVGFVDHRLFEPVAERIAGIGEHRTAHGGRTGRSSRHRDERSH